MDFKTKTLEVKKKRKRVGRGPGSGRGGTSTRGNKGQRARSGGKGTPYVGFEGGQMPLYRRLVKRGFTSLSRSKIDIINIDTLDKHFEDASDVSIEELKEKRLVKNNRTMVKVLGRGETTKKLNIKLNAISKTAKDKIEKNGGSFKTA